MNENVKNGLTFNGKAISTLLLMFVFSMFSIASFAQTTINGKVTNSDGESLPGVTVVEKGTMNGAITDMDGNYTVSVTTGDATLVFSFIGMRVQEIAVNNKTAVNCTLEQEIIGIDEVVVVGYGTQKKSDVTGSVISIGEDILESRPKTNLEQMLQGSMAGLSLTVNSSTAEGSSNTLLIRGQNSISASNTPLIIMDGIEYLGELSEINPEDILSLEILKDASSAAIYGSRGSNGVILITTKRGKSGEMTVSYNGSFGIDQMTNVPDLLTAKDFYELKQDRGEETTFIEDEGYAEGRDTDWIDLATRTGTRNQQNLSISGGTERTQYYISGSYTDVQGIAVNDQFKRYLFRINLDHKLSSWITFGTSTQFGYYDRSGRDANFGNAYTMNPLGIPFNDDGTYRIQVWEDGVYDKNPMLDVLYDQSDKNRRIISNNYLQFDFPFVKGLSYKLNTGYNYNSGLFQEYRGRNTYTGLSSNGDLAIENDYDEDWLIENILSYNREFGLHKLFITGLYSAQKEWNEGVDIDAEGFPNDVMSYYQPGKGTLIVPSTSFSESQHISQMFRANYAFDGRYLATFTIRRDGYSAFGADSKFGLFPSFAVGWNIANEGFMNSAEAIDVLKLRLSYGVNGNEAVSNYTTLPNLSSGNYVDVDKNTMYGFYPSRIGDPTLGWETTKSFNIGIDFNLFNNRIRGLFDAYQSHTYDLLLNKSISTVNGTSSITQNIGETENRGFEFQLTSVNIDKGDFSWRTDLNFSHYKTEIVHIGLTDEEGNYIDDIDSKWFIGYPVSVYYDYAFDGIWQEDADDTHQGDVEAGDVMVKDVIEDGDITPGDKVIQGQRIPDFIAGLTNTFIYKNFKFSFFLNSIYGIEKPNEFLRTSDSDLRKNRFPVEYWTLENASNTQPRNDRTQDVNPYGIEFYRDASFVRLQDINLSYSLSKKTLKSMGLGLKKVEFYGNIKNLHTFTNWTGLDPELNDQWNVPQTVTYLMGLKVNF
ncbi:MAG: SusC/RagA family TonB-linked outer membrane protein [Draconibacterium sp.]|nr:SusC/RagA family TonB-linked outer membrane protein [Draconibacterium sp.]